MRHLKGQSKVPDLAELLPDAVTRLEAAEKFSSDEAVVTELKSNVLRMIAELEVVRSQEDKHQAESA